MAEDRSPGPQTVRHVSPHPTARRASFLNDDVMELPVAHGEGRFVLADGTALPALEAAGQVALRHVDDAGKPTQEYPANPNGSPGAVAGVCDPTGRVFGLMPHPERHVDPLHHPRWARRGASTEGDGLRIFRSAVEAVRSA